MPDSPKFPPVEDAEWPQASLHLLEGFAGRLNVYRTMAHHPDLLSAWAPLRQHVVLDSVLGPELSEVVILRTGIRLGSNYEWAHHISRARACGMEDARIASISGEPSDMAPNDALLAGAVDELFNQSRLSEGTMKSITKTLGEKAIFDVIATVGFYSTLGYILNSCETPLDESIALELKESPLTS